MVMLVSLEQASQHLRRDTTDDDADLTLKIQGASRTVLKYLKGNTPFLDTAGEVEFDTAGDPIGVPEDVQIATLILIASFYKYREGEENLDYGRIPKAVSSLLYSLRTPTVE